MAPRIDTSLSKALLESDTLAAGVLEDAVQQQAIHGGALDTILLEMDLVGERRLAELISEAHGTSPVAVERFAKPDATAVGALPERMAVAMRLCPIFTDELGLHVVCAAPVDRGLVDELAALLQRSIQAHAVPELRLHQALGAAYGIPVDERFAALLVDVASPTVDKEQPTGDDVDAAARWDLVEALAHLAAADQRDAIARVSCAYARKFLPFAAMIGLRGGQVVGWYRAGPAEGVQFANRPFAIPDDSVLFHALQASGPSLGKPALSPGNAAFFGWLGRRRPRSVLIVPIALQERIIAALVADGGVRARDYSQLADLVAFAARLAPAFEKVVRHHKSSLPQPAPPPPLQTAPPPPPPPPPAPPPAPPPLPPPLPADAADGSEEPTARMPALVRTIDETTGEAPLAPPSERPSTPSAAPRPITLTAMPAVSLAPPPRDKQADGTSPFARNYVAQRATPPEPVAEPTAPMVLHSLSTPHIDKVIPTVTDAPPLGDGSRSFAEVTDSHAAEAWQGALKETVARGHQGGSAAKEEQARLFHEEEGWEEIRYEAPAAPLGVAAPPVAVPPTQALVQETLERLTPSEAEEKVPIIEAEPPSPVELLVDALEALDLHTVEYAQRQLLRLGKDVVPALAQRFPGRLRVDPFDPGENVRRAEELGALVEVLEKLGPAGLEAAVPHLDSRYPAHRFAAVLLFAQNPDERGVDLLRARLHDTEPRIRALATEALVPFIAHPRFETVLTHLRERLNSPLLDARRRAVQLLGAFRDVGAVPLLVATLEGRDRAEIGEDVRLALRLITLQDFGVRARGWERWWARARKKSRVDWLVEGLDSEDRELRTVAALELTALAGDDYGYRPDGDKRARQRGTASFARWWLDEQRRYGAGPVTSSPAASTGSSKSPDPSTSTT